MRKPTPFPKGIPFMTAGVSLAGYRRKPKLLKKPALRKAARLHKGIRKVPVRKARRVTEKLRYGYAKTMEKAVLEGKTLGAKFTTGPPMTLTEWNNVNKELAKIPSGVRAAIKTQCGELGLVKDHGITVDPDYAHLKGVKPRGWTSGHTWDSVPGCGGHVGKGTVIVANRLKEGHGSANIILHEQAHSFDVGGQISNSEKWKVLHKGEKWTRAYYKNYPEEAFAESFATYFHGDAKMRSGMSKPVRDFMREIEQKEKK